MLLMPDSPLRIPELTHVQIYKGQLQQRKYITESKNTPVISLLNIEIYMME